MNIHVDELMDYLACPQMYKFRHVDKTDVSLTPGGRANPHSIDESFGKALHKTIGYLFKRVQDGVVPNLSMLSNRWGYLWVKPRSDQEDLRFKEATWRDRHDEKRKQGWEKLQKLHEYYSDHGWGSPVMVDFDYTVSLGAHQLSGRIDLLRVVRSGGREHIEMVEFLDDARYAPFVHIRRDWRLTAAAYAIQQLMNVSVEKIVYHGIISGKLEATVRTADDFKDLESMLTMMEQSVDSNLFYPRFDNRCLKCPFQKLCEKGCYHVEDQQCERRDSSEAS